MSRCPEPFEIDLYRTAAPELLGVRRTEIEEHLPTCADCRRTLEALEAMPRRFHEKPDCDPGDAFTAVILSRARRPWRDRVWNPNWMPLPLALGWALTVLVALSLLLLRLLPDGVGHDRVTVGMPPAVIANAPCVAPVYVTDRAGHPLADCPVTVSSFGMFTYYGRTDAAGLCRATFTLPSWSRRHELEVKVYTRSGEHRLLLPVETLHAETLYLYTDKPMYQPGQTVRLRALCLQRITTHPVARQAISMTITDPHGNLVMRQTRQTSKWGVVTAEFPLDAQAMPGDYTVKAIYPPDTGLVKTRENVPPASIRTITVVRYTLPSLEATLTTDQGWLLPGQVTTGTVSARYTFGKPCAGARVQVMAQGNAPTALPFATATGHADAQGAFRFRLNLPARFPSRLPREGTAVIKAIITDAAGHVQEITHPLPCTTQAILVAVLPESGAPVRGVANDFYLVTSYPDGSPVAATVTLTAPVPTTIHTNSQGVGVFRYTPTGIAPLRVTLTARDAAGAAGRLNRVFHSAAQRLDQLAEPLLLRSPEIFLSTDKPIYTAGETLHLSIQSPGRHGVVYLAVMRGRQPVLTGAVTLRDGRGILALPLSANLGGLLTIQAYLPGEALDSATMIDGCPMLAGGNRTILVRPAETLHLTLQGLHTVKPDEPQTVRLRVTDEKGQGVQASVGLAAVDESIYAMEEQYPGVARLFFLLQRALDDPAMIVHTTNLPARYRLEHAIPLDQQIARVALAAYDAQPILRVAQYNRSVERHSQANVKMVRFLLVRVLLSVWMLFLLTVWLVRRWRALPAINANTVWLVILALMVATLSVLFAAGILIPWRTAVATIAAGGMPTERMGVILFLTVVSGTIWGLVLSRLARDPRRDVMLHALSALVLAAVLIPRLSGIAVSPSASSGDDAQNRTARLLAKIRAQLPSEGGIPAAVAARIQTYFPDTLAWLPEMVTDHRGEARITLPAAQRIATWRLSLLANTRDGRLGSVDLPFRVYQELGVDFSLPPRATVGDRFTVPVVVHNYTETPRLVTLSLAARNGITPVDVDSRRIMLPAGGMEKVFFALRAYAAGHAQVTIRAVSGALIRVAHSRLNVFPRGVHMEATDDVILEKRAKLQVRVPASADLSTSDFTLRLYPGAISQALDGLERIRLRPHGYCEPTCSDAMINLLVLQYARLRGIKDVRIPQRARANISLDFQRLLTFEVPGGGFSQFGDTPAEFALTALVLAQFQAMADVQPVDDALLDRTTRWLRMHWATAPPIERSFASLALARAGETEQVDSWLGVRSAQATVLSTYELAVLIPAAVALKHSLTRVLCATLAERANRDKAIAYWTSSPAGTAPASWMAWSDAEVTGLAVQALAESEYDDGLMNAGLKYLLLHREPAGDWGSSQATMQALRALLVSGMRAQSGEVEITVNGTLVPSVILHGDGEAKTINLSRYLRSGVNTVMLRASREVMPSCQLTARYVTEPLLAESRHPDALVVRYDMVQVPVGGPVSTTVRLVPPAPRALTMVDMVIPPGFMPVEEDLETLKAGGQLARYESSGAHLFLYFRQLAAPVTFTYRLRALSPAAVTVRSAVTYPLYRPQQRYMSLPGTLQSQETP